MNNNCEDKELIEGVIVCIKQIEKYFKNHTEKSMEKDWMVQDAVLYRMGLLGSFVSEISDNLKSKYDNFFWSISILKYEGIETAWGLYQANNTNSEPFESFKSIYKELENIYKKEYFAKNINEKEVKFDDNYEFPLKSKNSIWTVKNK
jgi:hypothetical protein